MASLFVVPWACLYKEEVAMSTNNGSSSRIGLYILLGLFVVVLATAGLLYTNSMERAKERAAITQHK
jgi:hypothetical protein